MLPHFPDNYETDYAYLKNLRKACNSQTFRLQTQHVFCKFKQVAKNEDEELAQDHCISIILSGANKTLSNQATLHLYTASLKGMRRYHKVKLSNFEIDGKKIRKPVRVQVNDTNLPQIQKSIVGAYKELHKPTSVNK